ncbi:kinase-like domain-containing protein, partial [Hyaloraphidium curvatum]
GTPLFPGGSPIAPPPVPQPSSKLLVSATDIVIDSSQKLGEGSFGVVYVGTLRGTRVAVKTLKGDLDEHTLKAFAKEVTNWEGLVQRNVLPLMAYCPSPPMMVTDLVRDGNLRKYLSARGWPLDLGLRFLEDVANGMVYLHGLGILHGDIKSLNEVGKSTAAGTVGGGLSGTPGFLAPELVDGAALQKPADVYAFSMLCYEVVSKGKYPLEELNPALVLYNVAVKGVRPERPEGVPDAVWSLMERCWDQDPKKRPTFVQVAKELDEIVG